ncbi:Scr1 family TA system antitoxin-like transcriptional regulator [Micromonospora sp. WMMD1102]|uniref:Scr1 family TA system antitoxin-like transcriptional regulator n=1 Tax=Micromonospora sp. WMMD1102 TaxID=3016105 RepID=UPI0024155B32|nr:Scr1 family TA system antitoxin-like transcriptional regulator [Micromonospora sp. WMMD1102]MDG4788839.1 Scr1 family TA system antitoxin-like transcriptional regulator [Micromonospora sp. WMMD1102]
MGLVTEYVLAELRLFRTEQRLSQEDFGRKIGYSGSHVSSVETSQRPPTDEYVQKIDDAFQTGGMFSRMLGKLAKLDSTPAWLRDWIEFERLARLLRWYEPAFIPGLLQTESYARATMAGMHLTPAQIDQRAQSRLERQTVLTADDPAQFVFVIDAMVLRRPVRGEPGVMAQQLQHLATVAELPHVQLLVVPKEVGLYPGIVLVRDTKDRDGGTLSFTPAHWRAFVHLARQQQPPTA